MAQVRQYTPKERNVLCMAYQKYKGKGKCYQKVVNEFSGSFPQTRVPNVSTVIRISSKQQEHSTVHNLNSRIRLEVGRLDSDMIRRACMDVKTRAQKVIAAEGGYIE